MLYRCATLALTIFSLLADGPSDNLADKVRPVPPPGQPIPDEARQELTSGLDKLRAELAELSASSNKMVRSLVPDVQIYFNALDYAFRYNEFLNGPKDVPDARKLLQQGLERAAELKSGKASWTSSAGLIVRGYVSKIDGSVQPYGLVVPSTYPSSFERPHRLDAWLHGRGENLTELRFLIDRQKDPGQFTPPGAFVLHLYGRYCNANKFAGEIDLFEALADVKHRYRIDDDRIVIRGFSMGGAACWQFAVHYPGEWAAAAPGAGFAETKEFLRVFQSEPVASPPWEQKLWHWYDCTDYAVNLFNLPTVAYSGEIDKQKQAADMMAAALREEGIELTHIIGPGAGHTYITKQHDARPEINARIDAIVGHGREIAPRAVKFTTWTLRYNKSHWVTLDALEQHWERARIDAEVRRTGIEAMTTNISALTFEFSPGQAPFSSKPLIVLDEQEVEAAPLQSDRSWVAHFRKEGGKWQLLSNEAYANLSALEKRPGLQGPIDDAFMDSFIMVMPTVAGLNNITETWISKEMTHAIDHWRQQFRGEARVRRDTEVTTNDIASANLVLWGDPSSNQFLKRIADQLPIKWTDKNVTLGNQNFPLDHHVPAFIYPNPLNPRRYIVVNSGVTFREYDYLNNARQIAKLPDYAIYDISTPRSSRYAAKVMTAGFFDEHWAFPK
jgi:dienelactone hydrolase